MLKQFVSLFLAASLSLSAGATDVSGVITTNTTWTKANSPYIMKGNLAVDSNVTLTIEPGVTVKADGWYTFFVDGKLIANGTDSDPIIFTSAVGNTKNSWNGIEFRKPAAKDSSQINYCRIEFAKRGISIHASAVHISNSIFENNERGIEVADGTKEKQTITYCIFTHNTCGVMNGCFWGGEISYNIFTYNNQAVEFENDAFVVIKNNQIYFNYDGIRSKGPNFCPAIISNSILSNTNTGIFITNDPFIVDSIANNIIGYNGVGIIVSAEEGKICHNSISMNGKGMVFGSWMNTGKLKIENNCIASNKEYNFVNSCPDNFSIPNNYWGSTDIGLIDAKILDYYDDPAKYGKILFFPFAGSPDTSCKTITQPTSITETSKAMTGVKAYPNPTTDIVHLQLTNAATDLSVVITDLTGKIIFTSPVTNQKLDINVQQWPAGLYLVKYQGNGTNGVIKLIKE